MTMTGTNQQSSAPLRVAYLIDSVDGDVTGTERQLLAMIERIDRAHVVPQLICLRESAWLRDRSIGCAVHHLGYHGFLHWTFPAVVRRLRRLVRAERIDIVQTYFEDAAVVGLLAARADQLPLLLTSRRDIGMGSERRWYHPILDRARVALDRSLAGVVANCEAVARHVAREDGVPPQKLFVVRNGLDSVEASLGASQPSPTFRIGMAASLRPIKRHDLLLDALARFQQQQPDLSFEARLWGDGPERARLEQRARQLAINDRIRFMGAVHDVPQRLRDVDVVVLCSDREGSSNAILEAMAAGKPVIATAVGGNPELVAADTGLLIPPGDSTALSTALQRLALDRDLRCTLGSAARRRAEQEFSWPRSLAALETVYRELLARHAVRTGQR